mgnify:CR=1 FL=1
MFANALMVSLANTARSLHAAETLVEITEAVKLRTVATNATVTKDIQAHTVQTTLAQAIHVCMMVSVLSLVVLMNANAKMVSLEQIVKSHHAQTTLVSLEIVSLPMLSLIIRVHISVLLMPIT